jgi:mRNA interferase HicA
VKKRDLEKTLRQLAKTAGVDFQYVGGTKHEKFKLNGIVLLIPRHREINEITAAEIIKAAKEILDDE